MPKAKSGKPAKLPDDPIAALVLRIAAAKSPAVAAQLLSELLYVLRDSQEPEAARAAAIQAGAWPALALQGRLTSPDTRGIAGDILGELACGSAQLTQELKVAKNLVPALRSALATSLLPAVVAAATTIRLAQTRSDIRVLATLESAEALLWALTSKEINREDDTHLSIAVSLLKPHLKVEDFVPWLAGGDEEKMGFALCVMADHLHVRNGVSHEPEALRTAKKLANKGAMPMFLRLLEHGPPSVHALAAFVIGQMFHVGSVHIPGRATAAKALMRVVRTDPPSAWNGRAMGFAQPRYIDLGVKFHIDIEDEVRGRTAYRAAEALLLDFEEVAEHSRLIAEERFLLDVLDLVKKAAPTRESAGRLIFALLRFLGQAQDPDSGAIPGEQVGYLVDTDVRDVLAGIVEAHPWVEAVGCLKLLEVAAVNLQLPAVSPVTMRAVVTAAHRCVDAPPNSTEGASDADESSEQAVSTLYALNMCRVELPPRIAVEDGPRLLAVFRHRLVTQGSNAHRAESTLTILVSLLLSKEWWQPALDAGLLTALVAFLLASPREAVLERRSAYLALEAVCALLGHGGRAAARAAHTAGLLDALAATLKSSHVRIAANSLPVVARLFLEETCRDEIRQKGLFPHAVLQVMRGKWDDPEGPYGRGLVCLGELFCHLDEAACQEVVKELRDAGAGPLLTSLMCVPYDHMREGAANCLAVLNGVLDRTEVYHQGAQGTDAPRTRKERVCGKCGATGKLVTCSGCMQTRYCSRECQMADWGAHKRTCKKKQDTGVD